MVQISMEHLLQKSAEARLTGNTIDYDVIILATARWDGGYSSTSYSLAKALSEKTRVFYVDNPFTLKHFLANRNSDQLRKRKNALLKGKDIFMRPDPDHPDLYNVTSRIVLPINWLSKGFLYDKLSWVNDRIVSEALNGIIGEFKIKKFVFINCFNPHFGRFFSWKQKPLATIYYNVDDMSQGPYVKKHGVYLEADAMKKSDFTMVTSTELKKLSGRYTDKVFLLPNAANVKLFQRAFRESLPVPAEIAALPPDKKVICYVGNICFRLDYDLLCRVAREHSDKILLMVGPFANDSYKTSGLNEFSNVVFAGKKNLDELPAYLQHSDCCIIPFLCNQLTKSIYPLKINEYLSAGKLVISTPFSEDIKSFRDVIYVSETYSDFVNNINKAISNDSEAEALKRVQSALPNNWEDRARQFMELVEDFLQWKT